MQEKYCPFCPFQKYNFQAKDETFITILWLLAYTADKIWETVRQADRRTDAMQFAMRP